MSTKHNDMLQARGYTIETSMPTGTVRDGWPTITYQVTISREGKPFWSGEYHLGIGHAPIGKVGFYDVPAQLRAAYNTVKDGKTLADKQLAADFAAWLAGPGFFSTRNRVTPGLADVLSSLVLDGAAYFDAESFEDWCSDFGSDPDSRRALDTFEACNETGRTLVRNLGREEVEAIREILSDY